MLNVLSFQDLSDMAIDGMSMRQAYLLACDMGRGTEFIHQWHYGGPGTEGFRAYLRDFHETVEALEHDDRFDRACAALASDAEAGVNGIPAPLEWGADSTTWDGTLRRYYAAAGGDSTINAEALLILFEIRRDYDRIVRVRQQHVTVV